MHGPVASCTEQEEKGETDKRERKEKLIKGKERRNCGHEAQYGGTPF
jgi:hypothetical protein